MSKAVWKTVTFRLPTGAGEKGTKPFFSDEEISFNGVGDDSTKRHWLPNRPANFEFCKTAQKPYDEVVVAFYKLIRKYDPSV